jgi:GWxTD domain-containing protein
MFLPWMFVQATALFALDTGVSHTVFATPERTYVEVAVGVAGQTVTYLPLDSLTLQAQVDILMLVKRGEEVVNYEKYRLTSPAVLAPQALLDVRRLALEPGKYILEVHFQDVNNPANRNFYQSELEVVRPNQLFLTDLQLLSSFKQEEGGSGFHKHGYFMEPLPFNFYDRFHTRLAFYAEVYHSDRGGLSAYQVRYSVEQETGGGQAVVRSSGSQQKGPTEIDAVLVQMDISKLESGNYRLVVELRDSTGTVLATRKRSFQRINPFLELDETKITDELLSAQFVEQLDESMLRFSLRAISATAPSSEADELNRVLRSKDLKQMRYYVFRHFVRINQNNPEAAYAAYVNKASAVHARFQSGFRYGFETDRGRTYLKFDRPDDVVHVEDDPGAFPYEIWIYYTFPKTGQQNVKFLFYNPTMAGDDYVLLHSSARGEIRNPQWERLLYSRNAADQEAGDNFIDAERVQRNLGRNARVYFEDF